ncbi:hypothetical protein [Geomonas sp. Red276]
MAVITSGLILSLFLLLPSAEAQSDYRSAVHRFLKTIKTKNPKAIAGMVAYPLHREPPLPRIDNQQQFLAAFDEVFDDGFLQALATSKVKEDWTDMGWNGIMFRHGVLWLDEDGKITAVNFETEKGIQKRKALIEADRKTLYVSLQNFEEPIFEWETKNYLIRVDRTGEDRYRYASWHKPKVKSDKPDLILTNGKRTFDGSGGNHYFDFKSGVISYRCYVWVIGADDTPPGELEVSKGGKTILNEPVTRIIMGR